MNPQASDRLHFELQLAYARPVVAMLAVLCLMEMRPAREVERPLSFLIAYFVAAILIVLLERALRRYNWRLPLLCDILVLVVFLYISTELLPAWFLLFFVAFAAAYRWSLRFSCFLCFGLLLLGFALGHAPRGARLAAQGLVVPDIVFFSFVPGSWGNGLPRRPQPALCGATNVPDARGQHHARGSRAWRNRCACCWKSCARNFMPKIALLAFRDVDLERIFLWQLKSGESERISPENLPLTRADGFLLDDMEASLCWNSVAGRGAAFGWDRRNGQALKNVPRVPGPTLQEFRIKNFISVAFDQDGHPVGRLFMVNRRPGHAGFAKEDLAWFERIAQNVSVSIESVFLLRHLRARAIEAERSRISRDLHDGILQTLLSIEIQIDVLRRKVSTQPEQVESGLTSLQQTVSNEGGELRHMVTDLRPLRVQSADMVDLMRGFAERFRNESGLALDLLIDSAELHAPDRVCRELFQIYREALNNIKKHAKASHVVVKLSQDDSRLALVVDDNGEGL